MKSIKIIFYPTIGFLIPSLTIAKAFISQNENCILVFNHLISEISSIVSSLGKVDVVASWNLNQHLADIGEASVEYIAWYHENGIDTINKNITEMTLLDNIKTIKLSYSTDGFSNVAWNDHVHNELSHFYKFKKIELGKFYCFFGVNAVLNRVVNWMDLIPIKAVYFRDAVSLLSCSNEVFLESNFEQKFFSTLKEKTIIFIPLRAWCTKFHGDYYDFGVGAKSLASIYISVIQSVLRGVEGDYLIVVKTDERFYDVQIEAISFLVDFYNGAVIDITKNINSLYTSEVIISHISKYSKKGYLVSLDSSTPFSVSALDLNWTYVIGCSRELLINIGAGVDSINYINSMVERVVDNIESFVKTENNHSRIRVASSDGLTFLDINYA